MLLTTGRWPERAGLGILWQAMPLEESQAAMEAGATTEACAEGRAITVASLPTHWCWQLANRERLQRGWTFECLMLWAIEKNQPGKPFEWQRLEEDSDSIISSELMVTSFAEHLRLPVSP